MAAVVAIIVTHRSSVTAPVLTTVGQLAAVPFYTAGGDPLMPAALVVLAVVAGWATGNSLRQRRVHAESLRDQAVTTERLRIAREVHDMIAHSVGVIAIQAGVGSRVLDTQPAEARKAFDVIEATSRQTLAGLRQVLGGLREPSAAPLGPAPGLADLPQVIAGAAGLRVTVHRNDETRPLPPHLDLSAFRIVQEAITNVVRHAHARGVLGDHRSR